MKRATMAIWQQIPLGERTNCGPSDCRLCHLFNMTAAVNRCDGCPVATSHRPGAVSAVSCSTYGDMLATTRPTLNWVA